MIYGYSRKSHKFRNFLLIFFLMIAVSAGSIFIYSIYSKIEVIDYSNDGNTTAIRLYNDAISEEDDVINSLEDITRCVVRDI